MSNLYPEVTVKIERSLLDKAEQLAQANDWTLGQFIEYLIYSYEPPQDGPTDDA